MIGAVDSGMVWSVLDQQGTQNMLRSALGDAAGLADYDTVKKRILGSRYTMNFSSGVNFDLDVITSDSMTATTLSSLLKAGMLYRKMTATPIERAPSRMSRSIPIAQNFKCILRLTTRGSSRYCTRNCSPPYRDRDRSAGVSPAVVWASSPAQAIAISTTLQSHRVFLCALCDSFATFAVKIFCLGLMTSGHPLSAFLPSLLC